MLPIIQILENQKEGTLNGQYWAPCTHDQAVNLTDEETEAQEGEVTQLGFSPLWASSPSSQQYLDVEFSQSAALLSEWFLKQAGLTTWLLALPGAGGGGGIGSSWLV